MPTRMRPSELVQAYRPQIRAILARYRVANPLVFGSVARGTDTADSDLDLLVDPTAETTLFDIGAIRLELRRLLDVPVDVVTPNALPEPIRERILAEAAPL